MRCFVFLVLSCGLLLEFGSAFTVSRKPVSLGYTNRISFKSQDRSQSSLFSGLEDENPTIETSSSSQTPIEVKEEKPYPIDVPSPILLSLSMILAIIGTGSTFDLMGGSPNLGFGPTVAIAAVVIPLCLFLFYASILKATAETEADDKEFMKGKY